MSFDVVIATRNRREALALSIPLILGQSRQPAKLIVIDSSDDHSAVAHAVAHASAGWDGEVIVEASAPGLPAQRNRGLSHVTADVVFFPDDDSLLHDGATEAIMAAYESDADGLVAGVCGVETMEPPPGVLSAAGYQRSAAHIRQSGRVRVRHRLDRRIAALNLSVHLGRILSERWPRPGWLVRPDYSVVEYMTGFRMSFRTDVIRTTGFDEALSGYALNEDIDASFAAARHGLLVGALKARIYHHRFPGGRGNDYALAASRVLNRIYVTLKHIHDGQLDEQEARRMRRALVGFLGARLVAGVIGIRSYSGRKGIQGTIRAIREGRSMFRSDRQGLPDAFRNACERVME